MPRRFSRLSMPVLVLLVVCGVRMTAAQSTGPAVTVREDETSFTLENGTVTAKVAKATGDLTSLQYKGLETIYRNADRVVGANFSQNASQGTRVVSKVTIDPKNNNGDIAEVSVKGTNIAALNADMEFRFALAR